jgi:hypothetical protein
MVDIWKGVGDENVSAPIEYGSPVNSSSIGIPGSTNLISNRSLVIE